MAEVVSKAASFLPICHFNNDDNKGQICNFTCSFSVRSKNKFVGWCCSLKGVFVGSRLDVVRDDDDDYVWSHLRGNSHFVYAKMGFSIGRAQRWWEKGLKQNMREITSADELVGSLLKAGDQLVVVDFFSLGCGGCKALHPKICQLTEMNPEVQFLQIKKFKDALAKHGPARCSLGPAKGLEEKELIALAANKDLSFTYTPNPVTPEAKPVYQGVLSESEAKSAGEALSASKTGTPYYSTLVTST